MQPQQPVMQAAHGGLAELHVPDHMFQEHNMAGGGIVAFDGGGEVPRFNGAYNNPLVGNPDWKGAAPSYDPTAGLYTDRAVIEGYRMAYPRLAKKFREDPNSLTAGELKVIQTLQQRGEVPMLTTAPGANPFEVSKRLAAAPDNAPPAQAPGITQPRQTTDLAGLASMVTDLPSASGAAPAGPAAPTAPGLPSINTKLPNALQGLQVPEAAKLDTSFIPEEKSLSGIEALRKQAYESAGVSEKPMTDYIESLKKEKEGFKKNKDDAFNDALIDFGTRMLSGRGANLLDIAGKSLNPAAEKYSQKLDKLKEQEHDLNKQEFAAADALNRYRQTGAESDLKEYREADKDRRVAQRDFAKTNAQFADTHAGRQFQYDTAVMQENGQNARASLSAKLQEAGLKIQSFSAETQRLALDKPTEASFLIDRVKQLYPNDPQKQIDAFSKALADTKPSGDNTLRASIGKDYSRTLAEMKLTNKEYSDALKNKDTKTIQRIEDEVYQKILRGYNIGSQNVQGTYNPKTEKVE